MKWFFILFLPSFVAVSGVWLLYRKKHRSQSAPADKGRPRRRFSSRACRNCVARIEYELNQTAVRKVYERLEHYFDTSRPYLEGRKITVDEVSKVLYTNKVYLSKAVKLHSGMNFCQYVNRHKIDYAVKIFRENPQLRITELAQMSGFNSVTSFNISFRAFMDMSPGDWCRKFRNEISLQGEAQASPDRGISLSEVRTVE